MAKRRGPYAAGSTLGKKLARKVNFNFRVKEEVLEFLKIGGDYHGVGFQTYMQWLLERALLEEIRYYGWESIRPVGFDRQQPKKQDEHREFLHLSKVARQRDRAMASGNNSDGSPQT
jgi:hypothetical protein